MTELRVDGTPSSLQPDVDLIVEDRGGGLLYERRELLVRTRAGDVVVADTVRGAPTRVVREETGEGVALGPRLLLLRPVVGGVDPEFLAGVLASAAETPHRTSSGRLDVRAVPLPSLSPEEQRARSAASHRLQRVEGLLRDIAALGERLARVGHHGLREGDLRPRELRK